jgi:hypothetical protein
MIVHNNPIHNNDTGRSRTINEDIHMDLYIIKGSQKKLVIPIDNIKYII